MSDVEKSESEAPAEEASDVPAESGAEEADNANEAGGESGVETGDVSAGISGVAGGIDVNAENSGEAMDMGMEDLGEEDEEDEENQLLTAVVPRLDDLIVKCLAENYDVYPALDRIPPEYLDNVVALLDPSQIEFSVAARYINAEKFWKRLSQERWPICQIACHGLSWKQLYIERHLQSLFEAYYPSNQGQNYERLIREVNAGKAFVHTVTIHQLLSHLDLSDILVDFPNLSCLTLKYGARKLGMDYDKSLFGMQLKDAMNLAKFLSRTRTLSRITLTENLLNDESIHILTSGLAKNDTLTYLDLSHNKIADNGAKRIARLVRAQGVLTHLDLGDNRIHEAGGKALGAALASNQVLQFLSLKLNPLGDTGGVAVMNSLVDKDSLTQLDLSGLGLTGESGPALTQLLKRQRSLTHLDVSGNTIPVSKDLVAALQKNSGITELDLRRNPVEDEEGLTEIKALLNKRYAAAKRARRLLFQAGWDEAL